MTPEIMLSTARFLESAARHILAEARRCGDSVDQEEVRIAISGLYISAKHLRDTRAAAMAPPRQAAAGGGHATNVGDSNAHGASGGAKKR